MTSTWGDPDFETAWPAPRRARRGGNHLIGFFLGLFILEVSATASAIPITVGFTARIVDADAPPGRDVTDVVVATGLGIGAVVSGFFVFESTDRDQDPTPSQGLYPDSVVDMAFELPSGLVISATPFLFGGFSVLGQTENRIYSIGGVSENSFNGLLPRYVGSEVFLFEDDGFYIDDRLPVPFAPLSEFDEALFNIYFTSVLDFPYPPSDGVSFSGRLLTLEVVPEPIAAALLAAAASAWLLMSGCRAARVRRTTH